MKKVLLMNVFPTFVGYGIFAILLATFSKIPSVGQPNIKHLVYSVFNIYSLK